jgi:acetyl-CoA C-acetyltransferase
MTDVVITGIGMTPVGEHWDVSLRSLASRAILAAEKDSGGMKPQALYIGNFLGSMISHQANLGALITDNTGLTGIESYTVEAAEASGAAAFRMAYLAVTSGYVDVAMALGVDKITDVTDGVEKIMATALDFDYEGFEGVTPAAQAALLMQRYMYQYGVSHDAFSWLPLLAHANAVHNPNALYRKAVKPDVVQQADVVIDPLTKYDIAPYADGAAAVILTRSGLLPKNPAQKPMRVLGSSLITDSLALYDRTDPLNFDAARLSVERACRQAGILPTDVDLFEMDDFTSIYAVLALEAAGFAHPGEGWKLGENGHVPMLTLGGSKARGNPVGATGIYQIGEAVTQLRGLAGAAQVPNARLAMVQSLGGPASTAVTHILKV